MNSTIALALTWAFREYSYQGELIKIINFLIFIKKHCARPTVVRTASTASITTLSRLTLSLLSNVGSVLSLSQSEGSIYALP